MPSLSRFFFKCSDFNSLTLSLVRLASTMYFDHVLSWEELKLLKEEQLLPKTIEFEHGLQKHLEGTFAKWLLVDCKQSNLIEVSMMIATMRQFEVFRIILEPIRFEVTFSPQWGSWFPQHRNPFRFTTACRWQNSDDSSLHQNYTTGGNHRMKQCIFCMIGSTKLILSGNMSISEDREIIVYHPETCQ